MKKAAEAPDGARRSLLRGSAGILALSTAVQGGGTQSTASATGADPSLFDFLGPEDRAALRSSEVQRDVSEAVRKAVAAVAQTGGTLSIPAGRYRLNRSIDLPPGVRLRGAGSHASSFLIGHSGHAFRSTAPINAATPVHVALADLGIICLDNRASRGAGFYDTGGTYVDLLGVLISGFRYGCVLDQTEIATIDRCQIAFARDANIWLVNGPDLEKAASTTYTNRITVTRCQIDQSDGFGIVDDGGRAHSFRDNNFNGCRKGHLRLAGFGEYVVDGNYFEGAGGPCLLISNKSLSGRNVQRPNVVTVTGNLFVAEENIHAITCEGAGALLLAGNSLSGSGASAVSGLNTIETLSSSANLVRNPAGLFEATRAYRQVSDELRLDHAARTQVPAIGPGRILEIAVDLPGVRPGDVALASFEPALGRVYALSSVVREGRVVIPLFNPAAVPSPAFNSLLRIRVHQA